MPSVAPGLLLAPPIAISTAEAHRWVDAARESAGRRGALTLDLEAISRWGDVARMAGDDFESPVFARHPEIRSAFEALVATHPRDDARLRLGRKHGTVTAVETLAQAAPGPEAIATT